MFYFQTGRKPWFTAASLPLVLLTGFCPISIAEAQPTLKETTVAVVPQDAAFFITSVGMRESLENFARGQLVTRLRAVPYVQELEREFQRQWESPRGQVEDVREALENPNIRDLVDLAVDMLSNEVFVYGGNDWCETLESMGRLQEKITLLAGQDAEEVRDFVRELDREDIAELRIPTLVLGFRVADDANIKNQLNTLESILRYGLGSEESLQPLIRRLRRHDLPTGQVLSLTVDTELVPENEDWDATERALFEKLQELLEDRSVTLTLGVNNNLVLLGISEDEDAVLSLGESSLPLLEHPQLEVLRDANPSRLRSVSYVSQRLLQLQWSANVGGYFQRASQPFIAALESEADQIENLEEWQAAIESDARTLDEFLEELSPQFGAQLAWSAETDQGWEGFQYDWSKQTSLENASPLSIIDHAGMNPILAIGWKGREVPQLKELIEFALEAAPPHIRQFIQLAERDADDREAALRIMDRAWPLVEEFYEILRDKIGPSLDQNTTVFSLAANWSTNFLPGMPPASEPLNLPELAVACELTDRELFLAGCVEIYGIFDSIVEIIRELEPNQIPEYYRVPRPKEEALAGATRYFYAELRDALPIEGFEPQITVSETTLVVGFSSRQVDDMLRPQDTDLLPEWLETHSPVGAVSYFNAGVLINAMEPWIRQGLQLSGKALSDPISDESGPVPTGNDVLQIVEALASSCGVAQASVVVQEDGSTVVHWRWE